jgi:A/G-specific adenine glycosylase
MTLRRALLAWYRRHARDLPWRRTRDPYAIWVSEVMLQQTRVETVLAYYGRFRERFPTLEVLAGAPASRVLKAWEGLGYYGRARRLHRAARETWTRHRGLPATRAGLRGLPGVGAYTADAVAAIAYGERCLPVDGNIRRVLARLFDLAARRDEDYREIGAPLLAGLRREAVGAMVQALMELGALICLPRRPHCADCPVRAFCRALAAGTIERRPLRAPRPKAPHHAVAILLLRDPRGRVLLQQRAPEGLLGGLWELPGGKIHAGEGREHAVRRELREELGIRRVRELRYLGAVDHAYSHFSVTLHLFAGTTDELPRVRRGPVAARWVEPRRISAYTLPRGTHKALRLWHEESGWTGSTRARTRSKAMS